MLTKKSVTTLKDNCITYAKEDAFICTTNIVGAMGAGIALVTKIKYPHAYQEYMRVYHSGKMTKNTIITVVTDYKKIVLFPTKIEWWNDSPIELILENLKELALCYKKSGIKSLAIPPLGMGNGKLNGEDIKTMIKGVEDMAGTMDIPVTLYLPDKYL